MGLRDRRNGGGGHHRFQMREKVMSIVDDSWIEDESGSKVYKANGRALHLRKKFVLEDANGAELAKVQERVVSIRDKIVIERDSGTATVHDALVGLRERCQAELLGYRSPDPGSAPAAQAHPDRQGSWALIGSLWVPSPIAMHELWNGWPSTVPRTLTRPLVPTNSTESGSTTWVHPALPGLCCMVARNSPSTTSGICVSRSADDADSRQRSAVSAMCAGWGQVSDTGRCGGVDVAHRSRLQMGMKGPHRTGASVRQTRGPGGYSNLSGPPIQSRCSHHGRIGRGDESSAGSRHSEGAPAGVKRARKTFAGRCSTRWRRCSPSGPWRSRATIQGHHRGLLHGH